MNGGGNTSNLKKFQDIAEKVIKKYQEGRCITLRTPEDIDNFFNSL